MNQILSILIHTVVEMLIFKTTEQISKGFPYAFGQKIVTLHRKRYLTNNRQNDLSL